MLVLHLTNCPAALTGDLTRWLLEISAGVYVGQVSARVRDALWERVRANCKNGRATLVFSSDGEQRLNFRVHGDGNVWEPIDFDGIKLMLRPSVSRISARQEASHGFSNAAKRRKAQHFANQKHKTEYPSSFVVIDVEATGLSLESDEIIEIGAIKVIDGATSDTFQTLVKLERPLPAPITELTGITDEMLIDGSAPERALAAFLEFIGNMPLVAHNSFFDRNILLRACRKHDLLLFKNGFIDTLSLARNLLRNLPNHNLAALAAHFGFPQINAHRSLGDCETTRLLFEKLIEISSTPFEKSPN